MTTHTTRRRVQAAAVAALASALLLAGCGSDDASSAQPAGSSGSAETTAADEAAGTETPGSAETAEAATTGESVGSQFEDDLDVDALGVTPTEDVFNVESPWNVAIRDAAVDPRSDQLLENSRFRSLPSFDGVERSERIDEGVYVNTTAWTVPVVAGGVPTLITCRQATCEDGDDDLTLQIPEDVDPDPLYDGWFTIFDTDSRTAYDLWRARREDDGTISYHFLRQWDLDGPGFNQPYVAAARGSGLPLFGGLIRPGELERGQINHALAISLPGPAADYFIQPASSTDGNNRRDALPEGARIRLKADFRITPPIDETSGDPLPFSAAQRRYAGYIVQALQRYGAIVVDRARVPTLYFQKVQLERGRTPLLYGWELKNLGLDDFEVIDFSNAERFPFPREDDSVDPTDVDPVDPVDPVDTAGTTSTSEDEQ